LARWEKSNEEEADSHEQQVAGRGPSNDMDFFGCAALNQAAYNRSTVHGIAASFLKSIP
jgi:hypothetical protein